MDKINKSFAVPLWKMAGHKFAKEAERYAFAIEAMINDVLENTPNVLPYMVPAKDVKAFYTYIDNDFTSVATAYINRPKKDLENLLIVMLLYLYEATYADRTITLKQKKTEWNEVLDTQENARELIAKGNIGNFKYTNTVKRLRSDDWSGGDDYDEYDLFSKDVIRDTGRLFALGHLIKIYGKTIRIGTTSITVRLEARRHSVYNGRQITVCVSELTFVRVDGDGDAIPVDS